MTDTEKIAAMMIRCSLATGHGDTVDDLLGELECQINELREKATLHSADAKVAWAECEALRKQVEELKGDPRGDRRSGVDDPRRHVAGPQEAGRGVGGGGQQDCPGTGGEDVTDYVSMTGTELLAACRDDGSKWAAAFCQIAKTHGLDIEEDWMTVWFANAIEHSQDVRNGTGPVVMPDGSAFFVATTK